MGILYLLLLQSKPQSRDRSDSTTSWRDKHFRWNWNPVNNLPPHVDGLSGGSRKLLACSSESQSLKQKSFVNIASTWQLWLHHFKLGWLKMLFWTNSLWSDCVTASTQQRWKWKTSPFTSVSPGHLFPLWARWHCLVILEVKALLLRHSSPPVPFNPIAPVLFVHSWTIHLLLYHSIPSLLYQFRRIVLQRSRTGCNVSAGFKLWVAAENSSVVSLDTGLTTA